MNSQGILLGPGVGRAIAEWIAVGGPTMDVADLAPGRFGAAQAGARYLSERSEKLSAGVCTVEPHELWPRTALVSW